MSLPLSQFFFSLLTLLHFFFFEQWQHRDLTYQQTTSHVCHASPSFCHINQHEKAPYSRPDWNFNCNSSGMFCHLLPSGTSYFFRNDLHCGEVLCSVCPWLLVTELYYLSHFFYFNLCLFFSPSRVTES